MAPAPRSILLRPHDAFATEETSSLLGPLLVVVCYGAIALASVAPVLLAVAELLPVSPSVDVAVGSEQVSAPGLAVAVVALGIPMLLVAWALVAVVTYALARVLGGSGDVRETAAFVGWGFLPKLLGALAVGLLILVAAALDPDATFAEVMVGSREQWEVGFASVSGPGGALVPLVVAVEVVASVWTTYVWYGGLSAVQALTRRRAVALALVLFLLFNGI